MYKWNLLNIVINYNFAYNKSTKPLFYFILEIEKKKMGSFISKKLYGLSDKILIELFWFFSDLTLKLNQNIHKIVKTNNKQELMRKCMFYTSDQ